MLLRTTTAGQIGNLLTGTMKEFNINHPKWAGAVGIMGESVIPTAIDLTKEVIKVYKSMGEN